MPIYKLIYFYSRARGEVARLLFALAGVEYQDVRIEYGSEEWLKMKPTTPLGQLPILEVDGQQLVQSKAIFRYLAKEFGFYGETNWDGAQIDTIMDTCEQLHTGVVPILRAEGEEKAKLQQKYRDETMPPILKGLEGLLRKENRYFAGEKITVADLEIYCDTEFASVVADVPVTELLKNYPKLLAIISNVESNERVASWLKKRPKTFL